MNHRVVCKISIQGLLRVCFPVILVIFGTSQLASQPLDDFHLSSVKLSESPFYQAQQTDLDYILEMDVDRLLAPYLLDAGIEPKAPRYGNWENTGLDGHIGGHYLSALSMMYASTGNAEMKERMEYMIEELAKCQEKNGNGYVGGIPNGKEVWKDISEGNIKAASFSLNDRWVPLYNIHKIYAGLRDAYQFGGSEKAKRMLVDLTDWMIGITKNLSDEQIQDMLRSEHGGLNEVFADVAEITGDDKYMDLAKRFSHRQVLDPLLENEDKLTGMHANTQIPKVIGYERIGELTNDQDWMDASDFFWETVTTNRSVTIGGNSVREHFNSLDDFSGMINSNQGPETCNTYNMLRLSKMLFLNNPDRKYMDYYEQTLYSHILSTQHPEKGGFVYFTPMRPQHYRVYSQPHESFWCCVGSGLENHTKYGEMIYAHSDTDLFVNLFIPSELDWSEKSVSVSQRTQFPFEESTALTFDMKKATTFNLKIRRPTWLKEEGFDVMVNGKSQKLNEENGYVSIERKWKSGDQVLIKLPMKTRAERLPDGSPWLSFIHGPIVLAAITDSTNLGGMWSDDSRMGHVADGGLYPLDEAPMIVANSNEEAISALEPVKGEPLTFQMNEVLYPEKYKDLKLIPFFRIHEARYVIYWSMIQQDELEGKLAGLREKEAKMLALEAITLDQVATGEQQPETEHSFKDEDSWTGTHRGEFWRMARGWFSYEFNNKGKEGKIFRVTYFGGDQGRNFDIMVNGETIASEEISRPRSDDFYTVDYELPDSLQKESQLTIKFSAKENSQTAGVYQIRLLSKKN